MRQSWFDDHDFLELAKTAFYPRLIQSALLDECNKAEQSVEVKLDRSSPSVSCRSDGRDARISWRGSYFPTYRASPSLSCRSCTTRPMVISFRLVCTNRPVSRTTLINPGG
jgi:hypothetical protein